MRRLVSIFALACILAQTSLPFFVAKEAKAAELDNIVETNIKLDSNKFPKNSSASGIFEKLGEFDFLPAEIFDSGSFPGIKFFDGNIYPMNNNPSVSTAGHGILVNGKKGYTSFGGVVDFYFKISSQTGQTAETNDLKNLLFILLLSKDKEEIPLHNIKNNSAPGFQVIYGNIPPGGSSETIGFTQEYTPERLRGVITYEVPGAGSSETLFGVRGYNITSLIQKKANSNSTGFGFSIPIKGLEAGTQYYAQMLVTKTTSSNPWTAYSKVLDFSTLAKNADGTENYGSYDPGKNIEDQLDTIAEYTDDEAAEEVSSEIIGELLSCSWRKPLTWFKGCMVIAFHDLIYTASAKVLEIGAKLMDIFIGFSISSFFYSDNIGVILEGWRIVRDVSNILFIFILLWTAFNIILRVNHHFNANRVITQLIIIGLLINFSLFFTRVIIDAGNIAARVFYNAITVTPGTDDLNEIQMITGEKEKKPAIKSLSGAITKGLGVTQMIDSDATKRALEGRNGLVFLVLVLGTVMNLVAAWTFFQCAFFFVGRIISLWAAMIFAPFAFTSTILPQLSQVPKIGWGVWLKNLLSAAFGAAFFMFFLFLIIKFCNSPILSDLTNNLQNGKISTGTLFALILLQFLFIIGLIKAAKSIASIMAGEFGGALASAVEGAAKFAGGAVLGVGAGAAAILGRNTLGRAAANVSQERLDSLKEKATGTGFGAWRARQQLGLIEGTKKASFDVRQNKVASQFSAATGINMNSGLNIPGLKSFNTANTVDGFQGARDRKTEKEMKRAERLGINETKKHQIEHDIEGRKDLIDKEEEELDRLRRNLAAAKLDPSGSFTDDRGVTKRKEEWQKEVNLKDSEVRDLKRGRQSAWTTTDIGKRKADGTTVTAADVGQKFQGLEQMEKALKNNDKALVREYLWNRMKKYSPYEMTNEKRDDYGQIKKFGEATTTKAKDKWKRFGESLMRSMYEGGLSGLVVGAALGPVGLGAIVGSSAVFLRETKGIGLSKWLSDYSKSFDKAGHNLEHGGDTKGGHDHGHGGSKDKYQAPVVNIFNSIFKGGSSGGGGGHSGGAGHSSGGGGGHH